MYPITLMFLFPLSGEQHEAKLPAVVWEGPPRPHSLTFSSAPRPRKESGLLQSFCSFARMPNRTHA